MLSSGTEPTAAVREGVEGQVGGCIVTAQGIVAGGSESDWKELTSKGKKGERPYICSLRWTAYNLAGTRLTKAIEMTKRSCMSLSCKHSRSGSCLAVIACFYRLISRQQPLPQSIISHPVIIVYRKQMWDLKRRARRCIRFMTCCGGRCWKLTGGMNDDGEGCSDGAGCFSAGGYLVEGPRTGWPIGRGH